MGSADPYPTVSGIAAVVTKRPADLKEAHELDGVESRMLAAFSPPLPAGDVRRAVAEVRAEFESARVRQFVPLLVERRVRDQLRASLPRYDPADATVTEGR
jgi:hypothetical protein